MKNFLKKLDGEALSVLQRIGALAHLNGTRAFVVGGCVRDLVLRQRVVDLDVAVEGDGISLARIFAAQNNAKVVAYQQFGTATVDLPAGGVVDFSSTRREQYPSAGSLPVVSKGSIHDDLLRRDFTINAMAIGINPDSFGIFLDDCKGLDDIKSKSIRVLHDKSFIDDPTRILRAVRFEARFQFCIEPKTLRLLKKALKEKSENAVKAQRYLEEFKKNLNEVKSFENIKRLSALGGLQFLGSNIKVEGKNLLFRNVARNLLWAKKSVKDWPGDNNWLLYFMAFLVGSSEKVVNQVGARFNFSKKDQRSLISSLSLNKTIGNLNVRQLSATEVFEILRSKSLEELVFMRSLSKYLLVQRRLDQFMLKWRLLKLQINGDDLKTLGVPPGKKMQLILDRVLFSVVEGNCVSRDEQLDCARSLCKTS